MPDASVTIIGGGVVGLAIAAELSPIYSPLYLLERREKYGQETSSRNSEVIHAGIYYPHNSLKANLCVEGRNLLYEMCERHGIPHRRITKIITATTPEEVPALEKLHQHGLRNGVPLQLLSERQVHAVEPHIASAAGILSPSTGIISAHGLMDYFFHIARDRGAQIQTHCEVVGIQKRSSDFLISIKEGTEVSTFTSERVINAAGLECDTISQLAGIDIDACGYRLRYARGSYFALPNSYRSLISRLVYPVPPKETLGVHALMDLGGRIKFGPDLELLPDRTLDYNVDERKRHAFAESVRRILPMVKDDDLTPDMSGIRARLWKHGGQSQDFIIREEADKGLSGFINLIGIESPGLTASPAIAKYVAKLLEAS
jgi:L-2-hydroxyglutarate oxidase LhgO